MATRLDRLFLLLETGSTHVTRRAAAQQLGEVQKLHPHDLHILLSKVHGYLKSGSWDTRIAAGQAVEAIAKNVPQSHHPINPIKPEPGVDGPPSIGVTSAQAQREASRLEFSKFDVARVLEQGASLLGSAGSEYELEVDVGGDPKERLAKQKRLLQKKLGLDVGLIGVETDDLFTDDDLKTLPQTPMSSNLLKPPASAADIVAQEMASLGPGLSSREKNRAKRKAKLLAKQRSKDGLEGTSMDKEEPTKKRLRAGSTFGSQASMSFDKAVVESLDNTIFLEEPGDWSFTSFCEQLTNDLFHQSWEIRHGAATGLREVLKAHGQSAGKSADTSVDQDVLNQMFLEDMSLRLLCVLALDRFGDFVSDEVVAPVRETCAQALGVVLHHMTPEAVHGVCTILLQLLAQNQWEVRHGGLLGLKYLLAVRKEMTEVLLPAVLPSIIQGLQDVDDDVRAVSAAALLPVTHVLIKTSPQQVMQILHTLWETLVELDDLTASTNSIMNLLASLLSHPSVCIQSSLSQPLETMVQRLWPFMRHNIVSVRRAVLDTLYTLLCTENPQMPVAAWIPSILTDMLRHVYQRCILETNRDILELVKKVWDALLQETPFEFVVQAAFPWVSTWLCLAMQPARVAIDPQMIIEAKHKPKETSKSPGKSSWKCQQTILEDDVEYIGGDISMTASQLDQEEAVLLARATAARLLGRLAPYLTLTIAPSEDGGLDPFSQVLQFHLNTKNAVQRMQVAMVIEEWAKAGLQNCKCPDGLKSTLVEVLSSTVYFEEVTNPFMKLQLECKSLVVSWRAIRPDILQTSFPSAFTVDQAKSLYDSVQPHLSQTVGGSDSNQDLQSKARQVLASVNEINEQQQKLSIRTQSCVTGALVSLQALPDKLNPLIRPLMDAVKKEESPLMQKRGAGNLARLLELCSSRQPCPNPKIIKNLCTCLCSDSSITPPASQPLRSSFSSTTTEPPSNTLGVPMPGPGGSRSSSPMTVGSGEGSSLQAIIPCDKLHGVLTLSKQQQQAVWTAASRRAAFMKSRSRDSSMPDIALGLGADPGGESSEAMKQAKIQRRGAEMALTTITAHFGSRLLEMIGKVWESMTGQLVEQIKPGKFDQASFLDKDHQAQELVSTMQVFESLAPVLHSCYHPKLEELLPHFITCLEHPYTSVRHMSSRCLGTMCKVITTATMNRLLMEVIPMLGAQEDEVKREGAVEALACVIEQLGMHIVPYIVLLVVPLLGRMSDQVDSIRLTATQCFATLIRLMPLEAGIPDPPAMTEALIEQKNRERCFLEQLLDGSKIDPFKVPVPIKAELRKYQQDGVNWLAFLNKYKLHGILCDDMGLGKTLQSICIMAGDHCNRGTAYKKTKSADSLPMPSIVVCPPTLTGHWVYEVQKFCSSQYLNPLHYTGPPTERTRLRSKVKKHNLVIVSYDIVRNDIDFFRTIDWNYCILDEGHIIKNGRTKLAKAIKQLNACHRLILSGTPIQNNVLELWSLFDFLLPGFLGTEKQFIARFAKPILQSRDAKSSSKEQEAGALAMEALHRQVLPFLLRRLKEDVLDDLPPKIIQDYYCELSPLQVQLYEDFAKSRAKMGVVETISSEAEDQKPKAPAAATGHIFQALQYLRKVCNHPLLVLNNKHPQYETVTKQLKVQKSSLHDINHAPKLIALKQLLLDCGIGVDALGSSPGSELTQSVVSQHRVLLFCQLKGMLDIVEKDLLRSQMPSVAYLRLDGSVPAGQRHDLVHRFNNDPSIDILLLTTHVGGLGLNLTGADTVIFVEHDWNPTKDLQAMDRAHRIGQKKVVNVYRLITRGTLEEKIMGLQKFKLNIANTVITQDNSSLQSMGTEQLLDLFNLDMNGPIGPGEATIEGNGSKSKQGPNSMNSILSNLGDLWDESQYETEYNLEDFMQSLTSR
ncbi:TATA-binding protein-associated factor 172 [Strongylocentrotus purpuratus]|uniref:TATA-binding protein-associated factor 172 n=1 Tax=Strongylocentrotus purpuratus TaxID=7668 RepID=A0A7M7NVK5_STRPU|nr:TATA-binding protein-associated factor 172 [Strongylocentrotus purpuratus]